jgi:diketogulonate reductase-like aldo/keto reductase
MRTISLFGVVFANICQSLAMIDEIPKIGFGTWHLQDNGANVSEIVAMAMENGYRHIDCAYAYQNQKDIGVGIKEGLRRTGLKRSDLWITSKLWNNRYVNHISWLNTVFLQLIVCK